MSKSNLEPGWSKKKHKEQHNLLKHSEALYIHPDKIGDFTKWEYDQEIRKPKIVWEKPIDFTKPFHEFQWTHATYNKIRLEVGFTWSAENIFRLIVAEPNAGQADRSISTRKDISILGQIEMIIKKEFKEAHHAR